MAPQKRRRQHGLAYRWLAAWFPIFAGLMVFLGALWVYTSFIKAPSLKQQWATIESKWSPARDASRAKLSTLAKATPFDLTAYQAEAKNYEAQITGWVDDVKKVGDWGPDANNAEQTFVNVGGELVAALKQAETVKTVADLAPLQDTITSLDTTFSEAVYGPTGVRVALQLPLPGATPSPMTFPFPSIAPSPTAGPSGSEAPSGSPLASPTAALPTASATP